MNKKERKEYIIRRYNERLKVYGHDPRALGWFKNRQKIRFKVLSEIGNLNRSSILDVGCGFGDLYGFLNERNLDIDYLGIDINPNLIQIASKVYPDAKFQVEDVLDMKGSDKFDYVFASGIFEFKLQNQEAFVQNMLKNMFNLSKKGVAADFLSSHVDYKNKDAFYAEPEKIFSFLKILSKRVTLRHDYMPFEFCVYIYKKDEINKRNVFKEFNNKV